MSAKEFLEQLEESLSGMQPEERDNAMAFYREYFMEAGEENEDDAAARLGSPQSVAERIISESGEDADVNYGASQAAAAPVPAETNISGGRIALAAGVLILGFPIWVTVFALWMSIAGLITSIPVACVIAALSAPVQAVVDFSSGNIGMGLFDTGMFLCSVGLVMLTWLPVAKFYVFSFKTIKKFAFRLFGRRV